jgi:hypothetical protein
MLQGLYQASKLSTIIKFTILKAEMWRYSAFLKFISSAINHKRICYHIIIVLKENKYDKAYQPRLPEDLASHVCRSVKEVLSMALLL